MVFQGLVPSVPSVLQRPSLLERRELTSVGSLHRSPMSLVLLLIQTNFDANHKLYIFMDLRYQCKDLKSMALNGHYDWYDEQNAYVLSIADLNSSCSGGKFWQRMQTFASHEVRFRHI